MNFGIQCLLSISVVIGSSFLGPSTYAQTEPGPNNSSTSTSTTSTTSTSSGQTTSPDDATRRQLEINKAAKLYQAKKYAEALAHYAKAAQSPAEDGESIIMEGYCYFSLKQYAKALQKYKQASAEGKLISIRNHAQKLAQTLDSYMKGICPGNCLKPSMPGWRKMNVPGTPDRLVWMVYPYLDPAGKGGSEYWSNDHMGEVIEYVNGRPINKGRCPICNGTGKVSLPE